MTNEQILEKQVEALEKLLQLKEAIIVEQDAKIARLTAPTWSSPGITFTPYVAPPINVPSVWTNNNCPKGGFHEYTQTWMGVVPPPCNKCGAASGATSGWITTNSGSTQIFNVDNSNPGINGNFTTLTKNDNITLTGAVVDNVTSISRK